MTLDLLGGLGTSIYLAQDVIFSNSSYSHIGPATPVQASQRQFDAVNTGTAETGAITHGDNYFNQIPSDIPEPAAQVLTGSALLALSLCLKRFKRS